MLCFLRFWLEIKQQTCHLIRTNLVQLMRMVRNNGSKLVKAMIKISKMADYGVVILACIAGESTRMNASAIAAKTKLPEPTVAKILKLLGKAELVTSIRGAGGGYVMDHAAHEISVADILIAIDGPVSLVSCLEGSEDKCFYESLCPSKGRWDEVNSAVFSALESVKLTDMMPAKAKSAGVISQTSTNYEGRA